MLSSFTPLPMDCSPPSPTVKPTPQSSIADLQSKFNHSRIASSNMNKHSNVLQTSTPLMMVASLTFTSHMEMESPAPPNGSNSTTMVQYLDMLTAMGQAPYCISLTYTQNPMISMTMRER